MNAPYQFYAVVPTSGRATAAMVLGIISILGGFFFGIPPIVAVVLGHLAMKETSTGYRAGHGQAVAGLVLGYISLVPMVATIIFFLTALGGAGLVGIAGYTY